MHRAVFLDRDNTIIHNDGDLGDPDQVKLFQGAASAIASIRGLGFKIVVVTNQGGVARGKYTEDDVDATNQRIAELLHEQANGALVDAFYYCPYHPDGSEPRYRREHPWRKPQPGMLLQAAEDLNLDLELCWMVGDAPRDIEAGIRANTRTILLSDPHRANELTEANTPDFYAQNLIEVARIVAQHLRPDRVDSSAVEHSPTENSQDQTAPRPGATYPAVQDLGTTRSTGKQTKPTARPFKPWAIQPIDPAATDAIETESEQEPAVDSPEPATPTTAAPAIPAKPTIEETSLTDPGLKSVLNQIARHLKHREAAHGEWSRYKTLAIGVVQPLAGAAVVFGLVSIEQIVPWLLGAIGLQLLVITLLILHGQD